MPDPLEAELSVMIATTRLLAAYLGKKALDEPSLDRNIESLCDVLRLEASKAFQERQLH